MRSLWVVLLAGCPKSGAPDPAPAEGGATPPVVYTWAPAEASPEPELLQSLITQFYDLDLLLSVSSGGKGRSTVVIASSPDGVLQDRCAATTTLELQPGGFTTSAGEVTFAAKGLQASLHAAELSGTVSEGSLALKSVRGLLDTREFLPLLGSGPDDALCAMMPAMGECVACPDGQPRCWPISFSDGEPTPVQADVVPQVVPRTREEVCGDPACVGVPACNGG